MSANQCIALGKGSAWSYLQFEPADLPSLFLLLCFGRFDVFTFGDLEEAVQLDAMLDVRVPEMS